MKKTISFLAAISLFALSSCTPSLNEEQKTKITSVAIATPEVKTEAYQAPSGGSDAARSAASGAGVYGGIIGSVVGSLVGEAIHATQNASFKKSSSSHFDQIAKNTPSDLNSTLKSNLTASVKTDPFFGPRLRSSSPYNFQSSVQSHGLRRTGKDTNGQILLSPSITTLIGLAQPEGKNLLSRAVVGTSPTKATIAQYAQNKTLLQKAYSEATQNASQKYSAILAKTSKK